MPLTPGTTLGPYQVTAKIGEGGMGEVYQARDTKLDRDVALKVLPEAFTADPDRLARFEREAKVLASLNHPNIGTIYGLEEAEGVKALVLELIEGPTLADRIKQGAIPVDEALPIAKQIAEALEAAHEAGVIHRDLKPANIKVREDGTVKVLDFGLAKAFQPDASDPSVSASPTMSLTAAATQMGMVIGTAAYMAPEQAKGKAVDKRADVWAFGAVLYEMLTGLKPFVGDDVSTTLARVIEREPDWDVLPSNLSPVLATYVRRCLAKEPKQRVHDVADVRLALNGAFETARDARSEGPQSEGWPRSLRWVGVLALAAGLGVLITGQVMRALPATVTIQRVSINLPASAPFATPRDARRALTFSQLAVSPDGARLVYGGAVDGRPLLHIRELDQTVAQPILGTEGAGQPFFSLDGQWIGFFASDGTSGEELKKVSVTGGTPIRLCTTSQGSGGVWSSDDEIVYSDGDPAELYRVSAAGGPCERLTSPSDESADQIVWPDLLPGSSAIIVSRVATFGVGAVGSIAAFSPETGEYHTLIERGHRARYLPSGHLVYYVDGDLMAVPFDVDRLLAIGNPVAVVEGVLGTNFSISETGMLVYVRRQALEERQDRLVWVDRQGQSDPAIAEPGDYGHLQLSPDGRHLALGSDDIWVIDLERETRTRLTSGDRGPGVAPITAWSPDGLQVTFNRQSGSGDYSLDRINADGSGESELLLNRPYFLTPGSWSPDGRELAFYQMLPGGSGNRDLWILRPGEDSEPTEFLATEFNERAPSFSPNGRWLAYVSDASGRDEIYVRPYPATSGGQVTISTDGGVEPVWSSDGQELFYRSGNAVMAVSIGSGAVLSPSPPQKLFEGRYRRGSAGVASYDVAADGTRFIMATVAPSAAVNLDVVLNWHQELLERVPIP